jgi:hypothetical protein
MNGTEIYCLKTKYVDIYNILSQNLPQIQWIHQLHSVQSFVTVDGKVTQPKSFFSDVNVYVFY